MAGYVTLDAVDRGLVRSLGVDGRVPFSAVAGVLGVSEHTVARRYRRLRVAGLLRVVGTVDVGRLGGRLWMVRIRCTPDVAEAIASGLAGRADTYSVQLLSGGTEVSAQVSSGGQVSSSAQVSSGGQVLIEELAWDRGVLGVTAHEVLPGSFEAPRWGPIDALDADQVARLRRPAPDLQDEIVVLDKRDRRLLEKLNDDGRPTYAELAKATGWSQSSVARRLDYLRRTGVLIFEVEVPPAALGYMVEARLWMVVQPGALVATAEALVAQPEISFVAITTGPTNLVAQAVCRDSADLYRFLTQEIAGLSGVNALETTPVLRTVKELHVMRQT